MRVAVCHFGADATDSIVTSPGAGGGPHVRVWNADGSPQSGGFMAYDPGFIGGVYVACGDVDPANPGDEIITGAGAGGGPHVKVFVRDGNLLGEFMAYDPKFTGGVRVAGSGANIVTAPGPGGGPTYGCGTCSAPTWAAGWRMTRRSPAACTSPAATCSATPSPKSSPVPGIPAGPTSAWESARPGARRVHGVPDVE